MQIIIDRKSVCSKVLMLIFMLLLTSPVFAQKNYNIKGQVRDSSSNNPIEMAVVGIIEVNKWVTTDKDGNYKLGKIPKGSYTFCVRCLGYKNFTKSIKVLSDIVNEKILLSPTNIKLNEIIVTAKESRNSNTSSIIGKDALDHLQPSSFSEVLELLPGGITVDPVLNSVNRMSLRQVGSDNNTSLGTSFIIDGMPLSNNATMDNSASWERLVSKRSTAFEGIDIRTISTDDIESIEIIRGIPSVRYGDITSGVVNIKRKIGEQSLRFRIKSDPSTKLFHVGKGFDLNNKYAKLNIDGDLLINKQDPRNVLENYKRITSSMRYENRYCAETNPFTLNINIDYTGSFDNVKEDEEINNGENDYFKTSYNSFRFITSGNWEGKNYNFFKRLYYSASVNYTVDKQIRDRLTSNDRDIPWTNSEVEGEHDGIFLPNQYQSYLKVIGKPLNIYTQIYSDFNLLVLNTNNKITIGGEWTYDKNLGDGELFDPSRPPYAGNTRPRPYSSIPSQQKQSFFAEDNLSMNIAGNKINVVAGIRSSRLLNLDKKYKISNKIFYEPRINVQLQLPLFFLKDRPVKVSLNAGIGKHIKFPTLNHLYPQKRYYDIVSVELLSPE